MDPFLSAVQNTTLIDAVTRDAILANVDLLLPEEKQQIMTLIQTAESKKTSVLAERDAKIAESEKAYIEKAKTFLTKRLPAALKEIEKSDRASEEEKLEALFTDLKNL